MATAAESKGRLHETVTTTETDLWNDSCSLEELAASIANGAVGATSNPTIVGDVLRKELDRWRPRVGELATANPTATEDEITWLLIEQMAAEAARLLLPVFEREGGRKGRLSIQTNPKLYRNAERIVEQGLHFASLAPNIQVKAPVTSAGIVALEELTAAGVNVNATVCFTVPQALAVAEAVERGLARCEAASDAVASMTPVCTIMLGRLDDWLQASADREGILLTPGRVNWAGIACLKRAHAVYRERGYRTRLLGAAFRHHLHWSELIGGDIVLTIPFAWQQRFDTSAIAVVPRFDDPVPPEAIDELSTLLPDFRRAYEPDGLTIDAFDTFGATVRTLRQFITSYQEVVATVRDLMLPNPDTA